MQMISNKEFLKLPRENRAILIAKDVISQIENKRYRPYSTYNTGTYPHIPKETDAYLYMRDNPEKVVCYGCARAALFISLVKFKNDLTIGDVENANFDYSDPRNNCLSSLGTTYLSSEFDFTQQRMIERSFEGGIVVGYLSEEILKKCVDFHLKWEKCYERTKKHLSFKGYLLKKICENIIKNNGTFVP